MSGGGRITLKKVIVEPSLTAPYSILVCLAKSSAESIGESILSTVRKAARLAVYEEIMISVKNHHIPPTILVERALGISSDPGGRRHVENTMGHLHGGKKGH